MPMLLKSCPRCQGDVEQRFSNDIPSCVQCGFEDYERRLVALPKSKALIADGNAYNLPYIGEQLAFMGRACAVRIFRNSTGRGSMAMPPIVTPCCPMPNCELPMLVFHVSGGAQRARVKARGGKVYVCLNRHRIEIVMGENAGWQ